MRFFYKSRKEKCKFKTGRQENGMVSNVKLHGRVGLYVSNEIQGVPDSKGGQGGRES